MDALTAAGCAGVYEDRAYGVRTDRAGLQAALDYVRDGDVLVTWKLDRLGRSLSHLIETVAALEKRGVGFRSITEAIDTTTPGGRLLSHLFGALGQFERDLIQERTRAGLAAAAARGRAGGRKPVVTEDKVKRAQTLVAKGLTVRKTATRAIVWGIETGGVAPALACHVRTFGERWLERRCCDGVTLLPLRQLGHDDRRTLADVVMRLRCRSCGGGPASVALVESPQQPPEAYGAPKRWRLSLVDPAG